MTTTAQALDALQQAAICYCGAFTSQPFATLRQHIESTAAELARLQAECEALRKDAERYRWLRSDDIEVRPGQREILVYMERLPFNEDQRRELLIESDLDAAIDAALSTSTAPSGAEE